MRRALKTCLGTLILLVLAVAAIVAWYVHAFTGIPFNSATRHTQVPLTPAWAFEPWLWEDDVNTAAFVRELLDGYREHDIPAATILIDSPWSTRYNDFIVDEERYPDPAGFFGQLESEGTNVVLWMTCMVDSENKDTAITSDQGWFEDARSQGYLAADGAQIGWWKGRGGFIDYANPEAMAWWQGMQQQVLDWGVDGWKLDGTATFFSSRWGSVPIPMHTAGGRRMTTRTYMDHYYRDEYRHGLTNHPEFITLSRSVDGALHPEGFAPLDAAPVTWVGDQDHTWSLEDEGFEEALLYIMNAAKLGYNVIGSDIGGYGGSDIPENLYIRWAQFSAFCGLFLNGGHGERRLWMRSDEELDIIRTYAWLHSELVPYMYGYTVNLVERGGPPLMQPVADTYTYRFGDAFFVAPIHRDETEWTVDLPEGTWHYLFDLSEAYEGPRTFTRDYSIDSFPVFIREGAVVPMNVRRNYTGFGDRSSEGYVTVLVVPGEANAFTYCDPHDAARRTTFSVEGQDEPVVTMTGTPQAHILRVYLPAAPAAVLKNETPLPEGDWTYDEGASQLIVRSEEPAADVSYRVQR